jgi:PHD/YefM family antitoxin component YafN of YafNO toxin-antitoxin module
MHILPVHSTYSVTEAQAQLLKLARFKEADLVTITRHDKPVAALIKWERLEAILETIELLADPEAMKHIRQAKDGQGRFFSLREIQKEMERRGAR